MVAPFSILASDSTHFLWTTLAPKSWAHHSTTPRLDHNSIDLLASIPWLFYHSYSLRGELYRDLIPDSWLKNLLFNNLLPDCLHSVGNPPPFSEGVFYDSLHITPPTLWFEDHKNKTHWKLHHLRFSGGAIVPHQPPKFWWWFCSQQVPEDTSWQHEEGQCNLCIWLRGPGAF